MKPSELALTIKARYEQLGTQKQVAEAMGLSPSTVSRYLRLLDQTAEAIEKIDAGELPVVAKKASPQLDIELTERENSLIQALARVGYATTSQLSRFQGLTENTTLNTVRKLVDHKFIAVDKHFRPSVYFLEARGCRLVGQKKDNRIVSGLIIHQRVLLNEIELTIRQKNATAVIQSRDDCIKLGLYPTVSEYWLKYDGGASLVIVDDFTMPERKLLRAMTRVHREQESKLDFIKTHWLTHISSVLIYSTTEAHKETLKNYWLNMKKAVIESRTMGVKRAAKKYKVSVSDLNVYLDHKKELDPIKVNFNTIEPIKGTV